MMNLNARLADNLLTKIPLGFVLCRRYLSTSNRSLRTPPMPPPNWLTQRVQSSPLAMKLFLGLGSILGYNSAKQVAGRRSFLVYESVCAPRADEEARFWKNACHLPPTFQSWFTITNLHIWLLTVRFRALPPPQADHFVQALIDHFFTDVENRICLVLQSRRPPLVPPPHSSYYHSSWHSQTVGERKRRAPSSLVTQQMKIFKEQWAGMGMAFDLGLAKGDMELAGAVWRNFLGARGARGIVYAASPGSQTGPYFRRSINLVGGSDAAVKKVDRTGLAVEEARDDKSGVHDFPPEMADEYVAFPETMLKLVEYVRRELVRLENLPDSVIQDGPIEDLKFGALTRAPTAKLLST